MSKRNPHAISLRPFWLLLAVGGGLLNVWHLLRQGESNRTHFANVTAFYHGDDLNDPCPESHPLPRRFLRP